ncbi:hypothetical protein [Streptomyces sp. NRRL S-87]|uniref:hypothetical protein n=1 Tax=Streptomyces sp. NRRL S-87 TaxID=1463920 RepID=UPI0004C1F98C|nr:hypothetical protein [Streptomyces sp. NRRL S-87]
MSISAQEYQAAVTAAGHCQCRNDSPGSCSGAHPGTGPFCLARTGDPEGPLLLAPVDPNTPDHEAAQLPADHLLVLCRACYGRRHHRALKARSARALADLNSAQLALDLDA